LNSVDNNDTISRYLNIEMNATNINTENDAGEKTAWLEIVRRQVGSLRFGVVQIVVHDSQVTQIEKTERVRLDRTRGQTF
jgi:hypothetical protein